MKEIIEKDIAANAQSKGNYIVKKLNELKNEFSFKDIRGKGLLLAIDLPAAKGSKITSECFKEGLIINSPQPSTIRLIPPLIVTEKEIDDMLQILSSVLKRVL